MRIRIGSWIVLVSASALLGGCNSDKDKNAEAPAGAAANVQGSAQASLVTPTLGGSVVAIGAHQVELAILENGLVQGLVYDARGKALAEAEAPKLSVALRTKGGGHPSATLAWAAPHACLEGRAQLEAGLVAEPIDVTLDLGAEHASATLDGYAILPFARFGGSVLAVGPYAVELLKKPDMVLAYVLDASGKAQGGADLALQLQLGAAAGTKLDFKWDPVRAGYTAALDGKLDLSNEPLRLALTASGKEYSGAVQSLKAVATARLDARAGLAAGASAKLELPAPRVDAQLNAGAQALGDARAHASADAHAGAAALAKTKASASAKLSAPAVKVQKSASASATSSKAKASAGVKASASFGFGK
jgi:hypothetical protein